MNKHNFSVAGFALPLLALTFLFGFAHGAGAATYYVATNGKDSNSCSSAQNTSTPKRNIMGSNGGLACLAGGDTLDIRGGTYEEMIRTSLTPLVPNGSAGAPTIIRGHSVKKLFFG